MSICSHHKFMSFKYRRMYELKVSDIRISMESVKERLSEIVLVRTAVRTVATVSEKLRVSVDKFPLFIRTATLSRKFKVSERLSLRIILTCKRSEKTKVSLRIGPTPGANLLVPSEREKESVIVTLIALMEIMLVEHLTDLYIH